MRQIYFDNSATTPICDEALERYIEVAKGHFGNPSSLHSLGVDAEHIIEGARRDILASLYTGVGDVVFTGSGSEANNLAILGRAYAKNRFRLGAKIITTMGEHASVDMPYQALERDGFTVVRIPTRDGEVDLAALEDALSGNVILVSVMLVNNETGAVYNIPEVAERVKKFAPEAYLHVDATQGYMKIPFSPEVLGADTVTVSSHKIEGPKGVGALYISPRVIKERGITAQVLGGGQEKGLRSGTENVPAIAAFGVAARVAQTNIEANAEKMSSLRDRLIASIENSPELSEIKITKPRYAAPHILNITLPGIRSETMLHYLSSEGIYVSSGSACSSNTGHKSAALLAFGKSEGEADSSMRISFSRNNTEEEVDALVDALRSGVARLARKR